MKQKILFVEDQLDLGNVVKRYLERTKFEVSWCTDGESAFELFKTESDAFDILVIDVQLPGMDGFDLAEKIINIDSNIPFLFVTARNDKADRIQGLQIGAADYISKPFDIDEVILRIKNIMKRNILPVKNVEVASEISIGDIRLLKNSFKLYVGDKHESMLTVREVELLEYLCNHPGQVLKREDILVHLWGENDYFLGRSLNVFICRLRKLLKVSNYLSIESVYGVGFVLNVKNSIQATSKASTEQYG
ncbi:two-component system response regulator [Arachidicoccus ginsenosidimutans]|uniref:response regulator transcription factor n=1 Tax=Arachidicoccus sp. BS20 TaxID=1850526 RepID=UPI0007F0F762|nr:response regulator transcription factor [Arachidicoccus sp. BS20]ANI89630.1 two-component system response regulator [Arachidicoccus sp. BS20]